MSLKSSMLLAYAMAAMAYNPSMGGCGYFREKLTQEELERLEKERQLKLIAIKKQRGVKEWYFDGVTIFAINKKNALRKLENYKKALEDFKKEWENATL